MYKKIQPIIFPKFNSINVNMMPFIFGDIQSIPEEIKPYQEIINSCNLEKGKIAYLTISESLVRSGTTQRRAGIHVESPFGMSWGGGGWGGMTPDTGLYMASNDGACQIWDEIIEERDKFGGCSVKTQGQKMQENMLYWLTDKTPHEALPSKENFKRQFIRIVSNDISVWFSKHNTPNPKGIQPECEIVHFDKFA